MGSRDRYRRSVRRFIPLLFVVGCQGDPVQGATDATSEDTAVDASASDSTAPDTGGPDGPVDTTSVDTSSVDTTSSDGASSDASFDVPLGDATCTDGKVTLPEAGAGGCPADMALIPAGQITGSLRNATFAKAFCMDITEVTAGEYAKGCTGPCVPATSCAPQTYGVSGKSNHPINCVTFAQADAHCKKLGKRLPTELEWEYAERGAPATGAGTLYPWGNALTAGDKCHLVWSASSGGATWPVGSFPAGHSPQGIMDLAGNVEEWTSTAEAGGHVRRGGGYQTTDPDACGADYGRGEDSGAVPDRGFRCVKDL